MTLLSNLDHTLDKAPTDTYTSTGQNRERIRHSHEDAPIGFSHGLWNNISPAKKNWIAALGILMIVLCFFAKTVFLGKPISKIARLAEWDSLFSAYWTGLGGSCDPSMIQLLIPYHFLVAKIWQSLNLPLWNPYSGFGVPLIGDIQAGVFSPLRILFFLHPTMHVYNLTLAFEVMLAALGTFVLSTSLGLTRFAALFAAIIFALCPYNLYYLELFSGSSYILLPWLVFSFTQLSQQPTIKRAILAGIVCAATILSSHPETAFFDICFGTLAMVALQISNQQSTNPTTSKLLLIVRNIVVAGTCAFCLSAPVFLPFLEYLFNSDSYKFTIGGSSWIPWQAIAYNLLQPGFGPVSPFLNIVTVITLPLAIIGINKTKRWIPCFALISLFALLITARIGIFNTLFVTRPFNCLITAYCMPVLLLLITMLSASGFDVLTQSIRTQQSKPLLVTLIGTGAIIGIPLLIYFLKVPLSIGDFDMMVPHMAVDIHAWKLQTLLAVVLVAVIAFIKYVPKFPKWICPITFLVITLVSQALVAKASLPIQNSFNYPLVEPIPFLQKSKGRVVALGDHLLRPNTGAVYGVADIRVHNPLFPARYRDFIRKCGAQVDMFNQTFTSFSPSMLDLASVRYVLSLEPITHVNSSSTNSIEKTHLLTVTPQGIHVYERRSCVPQAFLVHAVSLVHLPEEALKVISTPEFEPLQSAVVELTPEAGFNYFTNSGITIDDKPIQTNAAVRLQYHPYRHKDFVSLSRPNTNCVIVHTESTQAGLLILTDTFYPGWKAYVDEQDVPIVRTNYLFRGVKIPAGKHIIRFQYQPLSFWLGVCLAVGYSTLVIIPILVLKKYRKEHGAN